MNIKLNNLSDDELINHYTGIVQTNQDDMATLGYVYYPHNIEFEKEYKQELKRRLYRLRDLDEMLKGTNTELLLKGGD